MASSRNFAYALALLIATGLLTAAPANSAQQSLIQAAAAGNLARVKALLAAKADVDARDAKGGTALIGASENGHLDVVRALLAAKADVNAKNNVGYTPLILASGLGYLEVVQALLAAKADANAKNNFGYTPLILASYEDHLAVVQALLAAKADANTKMADNITALILASQNAHLGVVQALLAAKADVNAAAGGAADGRTALIQASLSGRLEVVRALLAAKADVNAKMVNGRTALMAASEQGHVDVVRALLAANANVDARMANGLTAKEIAARNGHPKVVQALKAQPLPPSDQTARDQDSGARKNTTSASATGNAENPQPSIPAWIMQGGKIYVASQIDEDVNPPEIDKAAFTWNMVHPLKKGSLAFMQRGENGQNVAWSVSTYTFDVGQNRVVYPIEAIVPPCSGSGCHLMLVGIFKAKIDIKAGDTLRMDGYQIRADRTVDAGDSIPVLSWGGSEYLSIEASNDGKPWLTAFRDETNPSDRASALEAWRIENEHVAEWIRVLEMMPKPVSVPRPEPVQVPSRAYCSASYTINLTVELGSDVTNSQNNILIELRRGAVGNSEVVDTKQFSGHTGTVAFSRLCAGSYFIDIGNGSPVAVAPSHVIRDHERIHSTIRVTLSNGNVSTMNRSQL